MSIISPERKLAAALNHFITEVEMTSSMDHRVHDYVNEIKHILLQHMETAAGRNP